ncbi:MAG: hypothetical protein ACOCTI_02215 [Phycisphaeraceae bacterium]
MLVAVINFVLFGGVCWYLVRVAAGRSRVAIPQLAPEHHGRVRRICGGTAIFLALIGLVRIALAVADFIRG